MFERHVLGLLNLVPEELWEKEFEDQVKECTEEKWVKKPEYWCGLILEPIPEVKEKVTDYRRLLSVCIGKMHKLGLGMKVMEDVIIV